MPRTTSIIETCGKAYSQLESQADSVLDQFLITAESGRDFHRAMEKVEGRLSSMERMRKSSNELDLNEITVLADALDSELAHAEKSAQGAVISEKQEEWAEEFEKVRDSLDRLCGHIGKMKESAEDYSGESAIEMDGLAEMFKREAKSCSMKLTKLKLLLSVKRHRIYSRLRIARKKAALFKSGAGEVLDKIAKSKMGKRMAEMKEEMTKFMLGTGKGRIFVDHKHLTFSTATRKMRLPFTQVAKYSLEEIAPVGETLDKVSNGRSIVIGTYELSGNRGVLRFGERTVVGDSIVYKEKSFGIKSLG